MSPCLAQETDPLPLRRVLIPPERVPRELERARQGVLMQLPREEFEERVRRAVQAGEALKNPPRLAEARYRATLVDSALVGSGQWTILHTAPVAGILPIAPFNLALRQARLENKPAILGALEGKTLGLLVEQAGQQLLAFDWSARSEVAPGELRFDLRIPACALTSLELELPADHQVTVFRDTCQLSGPQPAGTPDRRLWRLSCAGRSQVYLVIRRLAKPDQPPPLILAQLETTQILEPDLVEAEFVFHLEVLHNCIGELICECDPALKPVQVRLRDHEIESWDLQPGATTGAPSTLRIRLQEPVEGTLQFLRIRCQAPLPRDKSWTCPGLHLLGAVSRGETLKLRVPAYVRLEDWHPGTFRLAEARTEASGRQLLTLVGSGLGEGSPPSAAANPRSNAAERPPAVRPRARVTLQGLEYRARQLAWWRIGPDSSTLTVQLTYDVSRGRLFQIPMQLPAGWEVEAVEEDEAPPRNRLRHWTVLPAVNGSVPLLLELQRPLEPTLNERWTVQLHLTQTSGRERGPQDAPPGPLGEQRSLPFPRVVCDEARLREGVLAITVDPSYQANVLANLPPAASDRLPEREIGERDSDAASGRAGSARTPPWGGQPIDYVYSYRGEPVSGTLHLRPRQPQVRAHCTSKVVLASGRAAVLTRLAVQPETGSPETLDLYVSTPVSGAWHWKTERGTNSVRSIQRLYVAEAVPHLLALGASTVVDAACWLTSPWASGTLWRLSLAQPLREPLLLEATLDLTSQQLPEDPLPQLLPLAAGTPLEALTRAAVAQQTPWTLSTCRWEVPLLTVLAAERMEGEVSLHLAGADMVQVESAGLREVTTGSRTGASLPWRTFRYGPSPATLVLRGQLAATDRSAEAVVDQSQLHIYVEPTGRLLHQYRFTLWNWRQRTLPLCLPAGAQPLAAKADGQWITRLANAEPAPGIPVIELPVAGGGNRLHHFEVVYTVDVPVWRLWTRLEAPAPGLPVRAVAFRRIWHLPPGLAPLREQAYARLPGPGYGEPPYAASARRDSFFTFPFALSPFIAEKWGERQRQVLTEAGSAFRQQYRTKNGVYLGDALQVLAREASKEQVSLVIDAVTLHEAGVTPETPFPAAPEGTATEAAAALWESLGLAYVPCRPGALLTTQRQLETWQDSAGSERPLSASVEDALAEAVAQGHDRSGRFQAVADWLRENEHRGARGDSIASILDLQSSIPWTEWEPLAGTSAAQTLVVVRQEVVPGLALALAGLLIVMGWRVRREVRRTRLALLLTWLTLGGLAVVWLPTALQELVWWPTLAAAALAVVWYLRTAIRFSALPRSSGTKTATAAGLAVVLSVGLTGQASAPEPFTVWLVPGPPDTAKQTVLAPPELLEQLHTLAQRGAPGLQGIVLLRAVYEGKVAQTTAEFQAEFGAHCLSDDAILALPLGGVRLQEARIDGALAYPVALPGPRSGYTLKVPGRGAHTIRLRFEARVQSAGEDHEVRFPIPEVTQSQLTLLVPSGARFVQTAAGREGIQRLQADAQGTHLYADLGRVAILHARWRQEAVPVVQPVVHLQEIYLWDLQPAASRLLGLLHYTVQRGAPTTFTLSLPEHFEVHRVEPIASRTGSTPRLKDWLLSGTGSHQQVQLVFQNPVTDSVQILLELVPSRPLGTTAVLPLPAPQDAQAEEGYLAYRVEGSDVRGLRTPLRVTEITPAEFHRLWQAANVDDPGMPGRAYRFRRIPGAETFLRLDLRRPAVCARCLQDITWRVGSRQVDVHATAKLYSTDEDDLSLVEWEVPEEVVLAEVSGPDVRNWSRTGSKVQVWLQHSVDDTTVELTGWLPRRADQPLAPFVLPCLRFLSTRAQTTLLRVNCDSRRALHPTGRQNLWPLPEIHLSDQAWTYVSSASRYAGTFQVRPASANAGARILTFAEVRERSLTFVATVDCDVRQGELRSLTVRLRNWEGTDVRLEAPQQLRPPRRDRANRSWTWQVDLQPGITGTYRLKLTGSLPLEATAEVPMPEVSVDGVAPVERWLAVAGPELAVEDPRGLLAVADPAEALHWWPATKERVRRAGAAWKIDAEDWRLRLRPRSALVGARPVQVFLVEQAVTLLDGRRWGHQATYWLHHEAGTDLNILLPTGAKVLTVTVDGNDVTPLQPNAERLWLPLTGSGGARLVRLSWTFDVGRENLEHPNLERPRLDGVADGTVLWTVQVPDGYHLNAQDGEVRPAHPAGQDLRRAAAQLQLSAVLAEQAQGVPESRAGAQLLAAQERLYRWCGQAEYQLARLAGMAADTGPEGQSLTAWLQELRVQNQQLAGNRHFEKTRAKAENEAKASALGPRTYNPESSGVEHDALPASLRGDLLPERGTPTHWYAPRQAPAPELHLVAEHVQQTQQAWVHTVLLLVLLLHAWIASHYPRVLAWVLLTWPEQLVLLGLLSVQAFGASVVVVLLIWLGLCCRLFYLGRWLLGLRGSEQRVQAAE